MYARVVKTVFGPDTQWEAERIADLFSIMLKQEPGFKGITFLADYDNGEYLSISFWESETDVMHSLQSIRPRLHEVVGSKFQWEPSFQVYKVYEPDTDGPCADQNEK